MNKIVDAPDSARVVSKQFHLEPGWRGASAEGILDRIAEFSRDMDPEEDREIWTLLNEVLDVWDESR